MLTTRRTLMTGTAAALAGLQATKAQAATPGVTEKEIKLGTTSPYSGPASSFGIYGQAQLAYFKMVNDRGGINGRTVNLISLDNGYAPAKALEQTRVLVESHEVFAIAGFLGTSPNTAVQKYLNGKGIPNLFLTSGAERFFDPQKFPWIVPFYPLYIAQTAALAQYILKARPDPKIAVQFLNDDLGRDFLRGLKKGLGENAGSMIVKEIAHELGEPSIDSQVVECKASGANVFVQLTTAKFAAQGIRKVASLDWHPLHIVNSNCSSVGGTLLPAGLDNAKGLVTAWWELDPASPSNAERPEVKAYKAFLAKYLPSVALDDQTAVPAYNNAFMIEHVLARCGNELTRENLLKQATSLKDIRPPLYLDGIRVFNSSTDYRAVHTLQIKSFDGREWQPIGGLVDLDPLST